MSRGGARSGLLRIPTGESCSQVSRWYPSTERSRARWPVAAKAEVVPNRRSRRAIVLRGEALIPVDCALTIRRSHPHGDVAAVLGTLRMIGLEATRAEELYSAMDRHGERATKIEKALAARHLRNGTLVLCYVSSSRFPSIRSKPGSPCSQSCDIPSARFPGRNADLRAVRTTTRGAEGLHGRRQARRIDPEVDGDQVIANCLGV